MLVFGLRKHFSHSLQHAKAFVSNHQLVSVQATATAPLEETAPAGFVFFHVLGSAKNLTVTVFIDRYRHQNSHIFKFSAPVTAQKKPIYIDIRIASALQRAVPSILNVDIRFLVQLTDGRGRDLAAPESLSDVLNTPDGYACQVHSMSASSTLLSRRRYRSMIAVSKEIPLSWGTLRVTFPEVVVRLRL